MQVIKLQPLPALALIIGLWAIFQFSISKFCLRIGDEHLSAASFLFRTRRWEKNGETYNKIFKIRNWKKLLPDGGAVMKGGYSKKHLGSATKENLEKFVVESCRGELAHLLSILPFWVFGLFIPARGIIYMFIYAVLINLPCIIAQRYNRPRVLKVLTKMYKREKNKTDNP